MNTGQNYGDSFFLDSLFKNILYYCFLISYQSLNQTNLTLSRNFYFNNLLRREILKIMNFGKKIQIFKKIIARGLIN